MQHIAKYQDIVAQGESIDAMTARLHEDGLTALEAVKTVKALYGLTLNEAQQQILKHPAWTEEARHVVVLSDYLNKLWEKPLYATWFEWYHPGVHKMMPRAATDEAQQQEVERRLKEVTSANEQNRQHLLHEIANCSEEILYMLIAVLSKYVAPLLLPAIQTLHSIGSPENELATPWLVDFASDCRSDHFLKPEFLVGAVAKQGVSPSSFYLLLFCSLQCSLSLLCRAMCATQRN